MDVLTTTLATALVLMTSYSARQLWRKVTYVSPRKRGIDPVGEAEVFLAYGKTNEALKVLKNTLREEPENLSAKITLLRTYSSIGNSKAYSKLASEVQSSLTGQTVWKTIQDHGRSLDPENPLFQV